jgi:hypothetical protein
MLTTINPPESGEAGSRDPASPLPLAAASRAIDARRIAK